MIGDRGLVLSLILSLHKTHCTHTISIFFWYFERPNSCRKAFVESIPIFRIKYCISTNCNCAHKEIYLICWKWSSNCCDSKFHDNFSRVLGPVISVSIPYQTEYASLILQHPVPVVWSHWDSVPVWSHRVPVPSLVPHHSQVPRPTFMSLGPSPSLNSLEREGWVEEPDYPLTTLPTLFIYFLRKFLWHRTSLNCSHYKT